MAGAIGPPPQISPHDHRHPQPPIQERDSVITKAEEQLAYVMTLESQARVGSYQHEVSSAPWMILAAERAELARLSTDTLNPDNARGIR